MLAEEQIQDLRNNLIKKLTHYSGKEKIKLDIPDNVLDQILFDGPRRNKQIAFDFELMKKLDLSNVSFDNLFCIEEGLNFTGSKGAKINPQIIFYDYLKNSILCDVEFTGSFDGVDVSGANFTGSKGAKINPQTIENKSLENTVLCDVEFNGPFDSVNICGADFTGSKGAKICVKNNQQDNINGAKLEDVEIIPYSYGELEHSNIINKIEDSFSNIEVDTEQSSQEEQSLLGKSKILKKKIFGFFKSK